MARRHGRILRFDLPAARRGWIEAQIGSGALSSIPLEIGLEIADVLYREGYISGETIGDDIPWMLADLGFARCELDDWEWVDRLAGAPDGALHYSDATLNATLKEPTT